MKLTKITITNYKSIGDLEINFEGNVGLFGFLGLNESGKSNLLKAISMKDYLGEFNYNDSIHQENLGDDIEVKYYLDLDLTPKEFEELLKKNNDLEIPKEFLKTIKLKGVIITSIIEEGEEPVNELYFELENPEVEGWERDSEGKIKKITKGNEKKEEEDNEEPTEKKINLDDFLKKSLSDYVLKEAPKMIFWKSENKYLMNEKIDLETFKDDPSEHSIPLKNCFMLAGIDEEDISKKIEKILSDSVEQKNFVGDLDKVITKFVNDVWPEHDIGVGFAIQSNFVDFTVKDKKGKHQKIQNRSDGLRQFISFLLSSSAETKTGQLDNNILLIDEPDTHLHPTAQEYLRDELIEISKKNIVMFATHSSYLIDRNNFSNYYRVIKNGELKTEIEEFENNSITFSEIKYVVFGIPTTDYHNELYGWCEENKKTELEALDKKMSYKKINNGTVQDPEDISLPEYVRHQIHHPENENNTRFTSSQLKESIELLRKIKY